MVCILVAGPGDEEPADEKKLEEGDEDDPAPSRWAFERGAEGSAAGRGNGGASGEADEGGCEGGPGGEWGILAWDDADEDGADEDGVDVKALRGGEHIGEVALVEDVGA